MDRRGAADKHRDASEDAVLRVQTLPDAHRRRVLRAVGHREVACPDALVDAVQWAHQEQVWSQPEQQAALAPAQPDELEHLAILLPVQKRQALARASLLELAERLAQVWPDGQSLPREQAPALGPQEQPALALEQLRPE